MQSFFYFLLNSPRSYEKVLAELDKAHGADNLSDPVTFAEAQELQYFQACLSEAMRLRPAVGLPMYRKLPPGGMHINGQHYPGGLEVAVNGWVVHRDKSVFGHDADEYRPERWLEPNAKEMQRHMYQVSKQNQLLQVVRGYTVPIQQLRALSPPTVPQSPCTATELYIRS